MNAVAFALNKMRTRNFWGLVAIGAIVPGYLTAVIVMLTDPGTLLMRDCDKASNMSAYLIFNSHLFFCLSGMIALGEGLHFFENTGRGIPHKSGFLLWTVVIALALGSIELMMLKLSC